MESHYQKTIAKYYPLFRNTTVDNIYRIYYMCVLCTVENISKPYSANARKTKSSESNKYYTILNDENDHAIYYYIILYRYCFIKQKPR